MIVRARPPKRPAAKKTAIPLKVRVVANRAPAAIKKAQRIALLRERGY